MPLTRIAILGSSPFNQITYYMPITQYGRSRNRPLWPLDLSLNSRSWRCLSPFVNLSYFDVGPIRNSRTSASVETARCKHYKLPDAPGWWSSTSDDVLLLSRYIWSERKTSSQGMCDILNLKRFFFSLIVENTEDASFLDNFLSTVNITTGKY